MTNYKRIFVNLLLLLIVLLIMFAVLETVIRVLGLASIPKFRQTDDLLHHSFKPNTEGWHKFRAEYNVHYAVNSLGMRDEYIREINLSKGENEFRIVFMGDSFTEGYGLNYNETFPKLVGDRLNNEFPNKKWEVFNAGVASYSPIIEEVYLKNKILGIKPDLLILNLDLSDFQDDYTRATDGTIFDAEGRPLRVLPPKKSLIKDFLRGHIYTYVFIKNIGREHLQRKQISEKNLGDIRYDTLAFTRSDDNIIKNQEYINSTQFYLLNIKEELSKNNISFLLVTYPSAVQVSAEEWNPGREQYFFNNTNIYSSKIFDVIESFAEENNIPYLNTLPALKSSTLYPLYYSYDPHFTKNGAGVMADAIYAKLISENFYENN